MKLYREFTSQAQIDAQYNAGSRVEDYPRWMQWYLDNSATLRQQQPPKRVQYGPSVSEHLLIFPARDAGATVIVFIHGGYWRAGTADDFAFVAAGLVARGFCVAVTNYTLCPSVTVDEITRQSRAAVAWLYGGVALYNGNPDKIAVVGHSAGGQQVAMLLCTDWTADYALPENLVKWAVPISGVFDLIPLRYSYLQPILSLSYETIARQSPITIEIRNHAAVRVVVGALESTEFQRQSNEYDQWCRQHGLDCALWQMSNRHHFNVIEDFNSADSELVNRLSDWML